MREPIGVLVMDYGSPTGPEAIGAYYTHIRHGRPPSEAQLADLERRYEAIGGVSPLREITRAQANGIQQGLDGWAPGRYRVYHGSKHAPPFIEDAVGRMRAEDVERAIGLVLAPHYARLSVGSYIERARDAAGGAIDFTFVESWHLADGYVSFLADEVTEALARMPDDLQPGTHVLFTAHSLPAWIVEEGDPYARQLRETAEAVADRIDVPRWSTAWQSAGATPEAWLGPDVAEVMRELAEEDSVDAVIVCPCGFVADHLEVLYDLDVEARRVANDLGIAFDRTAMPNSDPRFTETLAKVVVAADPSRGRRSRAHQRSGSERRDRHRGREKS
ncbi:MAG: ferrochelatase [Actinomycetota bacterium]|nr:ferrochelatase [Actinomycetota bacterium]